MATKKNNPKSSVETTRENLDKVLALASEHLGNPQLASIVNLGLAVLDHLAAKYLPKFDPGLEPDKPFAHRRRRNSLKTRGFIRAACADRLIHPWGLHAG